MRRSLILFTLCLCAFAVNLDVTLVNVTLPTLVTVVPRRHQHAGQADQQPQGRELLDLARPVERVGDVLETLEQSPGAGRVDDAPLHHLAAAQLGPGTLARSPCRHVRH